MNSKVGIYLASYKAFHPHYDLVYQDINGLRDIPGDMLDVDLLKYDFIIATPPCNYWSRANYRRETSDYSLKTKHLLPDILQKLSKLDKPYIVENVRNYPLMSKNYLYLYSPYIYEHGRHTYWTNVQLDLSDVYQIKDNIQNKNREKRQGDINVYNVIEKFLKVVNYGK